MSDYAHAESLVSTQWLADHLEDPSIRIVEVVWGVNGPAGMAVYEAGHIPGAVVWDYQADYYSPEDGDVADKSHIEEQLSRSGVNAETTIVLYGGQQNMNATFEFWLLKVYGHQDVRLLDGGRKKWLEESRPLTSVAPAYASTNYRARDPDWRLRVTRADVLQAIGKTQVLLVDARTSEMYQGFDEAGTARGGHIPGAISLAAWIETNPDGTAREVRLPTTRPDGTFRAANELRALFEDLGITEDNEIITYCLRAGASTHAWFVLTQLLGYPNVREYDRSWAEWGNREELPIVA